MWDVVWTDPDKELVGEHRAKKGNDEAKQNKKHKSHSGRASISTTSSRSSIETPFSLFRGRGLKRINAPSTPAGMAPSISSGLNSPGINSARSPLSQAFEEIGRPSSDRASSSIFKCHVDSPLNASPGPGRLVESTSGISRSTSNDVDSIFSSSIADTTTTSSTDDILEDGAMSDFERMRSIIQILEEGAPASTSSGILQTPESRKSSGKGSSELLRPGKLEARDVSTPPVSPSHSARQSLSSLNLDQPVLPAFLVPPLKSPLRMFAPRWNATVMTQREDGQKEGDDQDLTPPASRESMFRTLNREPLETHSIRGGRASVRLETLEEELSKMAGTGAKEQVTILQGLWKQTNCLGTESLRGDGKEVSEMKRWMLSAMHNLDLEYSTGRAQALTGPSVTASMVMILHESSVFVSYLATLHPTKQLYDLSLTGRSFDKLTNVRNIPVATISTDAFPVAPRIFEAVHSLTLTSQCPSDELGGIVQSVAKCLKMGGIFHLTLIDPLPRAGTMGPRMRAWIEEHLLRNLARKSRCMSPSTMFPKILGEAGLRNKGSTLTTTKFFAMPQSARSGEEDPDAEVERLRAESEVKAEVRSLVGRMLWVEVWGAHVTAAKWWWEEEACVRECLELGTFWEYHTIKGVNGEGC